MARITGSFAPVPTPLTDAGGIDRRALVAHLQWLEGKADGALILGTNGEFPSLTLAERRAVAETAAAADVGLALLLNVGSCALGEVEEMLAVAEDGGFAAVLCPPPFYFRSAPVAGVAAFLGRVLDASSLPVLLYHIPQVTGVPVSDELLEAIGPHPNLVGVKDSTGRPGEMERLAPRFASGSYLVGSDRLVRRCRDAGGAGSISAVANVAPAAVRAAWDDPSAQARLDALRELLEEVGLIAAAKVILRHLGLGGYATRPPQAPCPPERAPELICRFLELTDTP